MPRLALIDNDYLNKLTKIKSDKDIFDIIKRFFIALDINVLMHPLVYENELLYPNELSDRLFSEKIINLVDLKSIYINKTYYNTLFKQIYRIFTRQSCPINDPLNKWIKNKDLGEIHIATLSYFMDFDYFLTDDQKALTHLSKIIKNQTEKDVRIISRKDCFEMTKGSKIINRAERRLLSNIQN